jgi:enoyl-CoA hydratase
MKYRDTLYNKEGNIAILILNRPEVLNALNANVYNELYYRFQEVEDDPEVRLVIITGAGEKAFAAGGDIALMQPLDSMQISKAMMKSRRAQDCIYKLSKPVIAAINGFALGGGLELAMVCDLRVASENAKFGQPEINLGIIPGSGGTQRLPRLIGLCKAKELVYTGDIIDANAALTLGLINKVVPAARLMEETKTLAKKILEKSSVTLSFAKRSMNTGIETDLNSALDIEVYLFAQCFDTEDQKEGMLAYLQKRKAEFKNK